MPPEDYDKFEEFKRIQRETWKPFDDVVRAAREFFRTLQEMENGDITAGWLRDKHPELSLEEAEEYRLFCKANTIVYMGCYGDGSIMWPLWQSFKAELNSL